MTSPMYDGQSVTGMVDYNSWNYYHYTPQSIETMVINVTQSGGGDCDLYVRRDKAPSLTDYDGRDTSLHSTFSMRISDAQFSTWYFGVFGYARCQYSIKVASSSGCPICVHGTCDPNDGVCVCQTNWVGPLCHKHVLHITDFSRAYLDNIARGDWAYYSVNVKARTLLTVNLLEKETVGAFWLFVSSKSAPTLTDYDPALTDKESNTHHHSVTTTPSANGLYFIGVYGSPFSLGNATATYPFSLQVWDSPF